MRTGMNYAIECIERAYRMKKDSRLKPFPTDDLNLYYHNYFIYNVHIIKCFIILSQCTIIDGTSLHYRILTLHLSKCKILSATTKQEIFSSLRAILLGMERKSVFIDSLICWNS